MKASHANQRITKTLCITALLLLGATSPLSAQAGWKPLSDKGFTFSFPSDWNCIDMGGDNYGGIKGYLKALSPMGKKNFVMVVMLFPEFSLDLAANKMTYEDFMKMIFASALKSSDMADSKIEQTEAVLNHGKVPAFMVVNKESKEGFRASLICGDLVNGNAAIIMLTVDMAGEGAADGGGYLDMAEQIMASFTFPK
jgi:hypothetical protein